MAIEDVLRREWDAGLPSVAGAVVRGRVPMRQGLVDAVIVAALPEVQARVGMVRGLQMQITGERQVSARVTVNLGLFTLPVEVPVTLPERMTERGEVVVALGGLGALAGAVGGLLGSVPGVTFAGNMVRVDVNRVLAGQGVGMVQVRELAFSGSAGEVWVDFGVEVVGS